jgi:hypothetical protein
VWKSATEEDLMIDVNCEGHCQQYTMAYEQLLEFPFFSASSS